MSAVLTPRRCRLRTLGIWGVALITAAAVMTVLTVVGGPPVFQSIDQAWAAFILETRTPFWSEVNAALDWLGYTGIFYYHGLLFLLLIWQRPWAALFTAAAALSMLAITQNLKPLVDRARPEQSLVETATASFPSGHTTATAAAVVATGLIVGRLWVWLVGAVLLLSTMVSRTYLGVHWVSDTISGWLLAAGVVILLWLCLQDRCLAEQRRKEPGDR